MICFSTFLSPCNSRSLNSDSAKTSPTTPCNNQGYPLAPSASLVLTDVDNIEFMDTGHEDSSTEEVIQSHLFKTTGLHCIKHF